MPKFEEIKVTTNAKESTFVPASNDGVATWTVNGELLDANVVLTYSRRQATAKQQTRKAQLRLATPLVSICENTCAVTSRGNVLYTLENVVSATATAAEREEAYDQLVMLLQDTSIKDAFINNGSFYS